MLPFIFHMFSFPPVFYEEHPEADDRFIVFPVRARFMSLPRRSAFAPRPPWHSCLFIPPGPLATTDSPPSQEQVENLRPYEGLHRQRVSGLFITPAFFVHKSSSSLLPLPHYSARPPPPHHTALLPSSLICSGPYRRIVPFSKPLRLFCLPPPPPPPIFFTPCTARGPVTILCPWRSPAG